MSGGADPHVCFALDVEWPRYPLMTKRGVPSKSKRAGHRLPWLSMNVVRRMRAQAYHGLMAIWREAARKRGVAIGEAVERYPVRVGVQLFKVTSHEMDVGAVIEGLKPILDGLVEAGTLRADDPRHVGGFDVASPVTVGRKGYAGVRLTLCDHPILLGTSTIVAEVGG